VPWMTFALIDDVRAGCGPCVEFRFNFQIAREANAPLPGENGCRATLWSSLPFPQSKGSGAPSGAERLMAPFGAPPRCFDIRHCRSDRTQEPGYDSDPWHRSLLRFRHVSRNAPYPSRDSNIIIKVPCNVKLRYGAGGRRTSVRLLERICTLPESRRLDANVTTGEAGHRLQ
jgi:hypothetical protein